MKPLIVFELKKMFGRKITWVGMAAILLINTLFLVSTSQNMYAFDSKSREAHGLEAIRLDQELIRPYEGELTDEKVRLMLEEFSNQVDLHGMNATILFAPVDFAESYIPFPITCLTLLRYQALLVFTCALGTVGLTLLFSALCSSPLSALALSLAAFALPAFL